MESGGDMYHFLNVYPSYDCNDNMLDFNTNIVWGSMFGLQWLQFCRDDCDMCDFGYVPNLRFHTKAHDTVS